jgi:hypothetical protein
MPLGARWVEGAFYFTTGAGTRKSKNLRENPQCMLCVATEPFDLVFEGSASQVRDVATTGRIAEAFRADGWEATVVEGDASLTARTARPRLDHRQRCDYARLVGRQRKPCERRHRHWSNIRADQKSVHQH